MPKENIRMSEDEIHRFLRSQAMAVVVAGRAPAAPWGALCRFFYDTELIAFSLPRVDPIIGELAEDGRVCCVVEQFPSYYEIKGVLLHGHATRRDDSEDDPAMFDLTVDDIISFDFGKLKSNPDRTRS